MPQVAPIKIAFPPSDSPDVVNYRLYYVDTSETLGLNSPYVDLPPQAADPDGDMRFNAGDVKDAQGNIVFEDGRYNLGVAAIDDAGNESEMSTLLDVPLDFVPPNPPGQIRIEVG
ncbi:MAG: hypothetical protein BBJ57_02130 [Desulfobacterales bacterium PC51MH44]|nr:MAG: hypothetical protein BBJ57_02130 [Desulfobacterales bacterium PC51MH44]